MPVSRSYNRLIRHSTQGTLFSQHNYEVGVTARLHPFLSYPRLKNESVADTIACNNDFYINGIFLNADDEVYYARKAWYRDNLADISQQLTQLGFKPDLLQLESAHRNYKRLWAIQLSR